MKKYVLCIVTIFVYASLFGQKSKILQIDSAEKNSTEYIFHFSKDSVENAIVKAFDRKHGGKCYCEDMIIYCGKEIVARIGNTLLRNPKTITYETKDTLFYLFQIKCPSKVYFQKNGYPYTFAPARIQFYIDTLGENLTKVWIEVVKPEVLYGKTWHSLPHGVRTWKYKAVPSTTVEEYEILQILGNTLGEKDMPEIKIPKKIVF